MIDTSKKILLKLISFILSIKFIECVPIDYCMFDVNKTDCGLPPTPIFAYYKPGSRCEVEMWRGCPTYNKFDNEYDCSDICIGRLGKNELEYIDETGDIYDEIMHIPEKDAKILHDVVIDIHDKIIHKGETGSDTTPFTGAYIVDTLFFPVNISDLFSKEDFESDDDIEDTGEEESEDSHQEDTANHEGAAEHEFDRQENIARRSGDWPEETSYKESDQEEDTTDQSREEE